MAQYTIQVKRILEAYYYDSHPGTEMHQIAAIRPKLLCESEYKKIFDFEFPLLQSMSKQQLCTMILMHYYTREIGLETVALWKLFLEARLIEIMPYYVQLENANISLAEALINRTSKESIKRDGSQTDDNSRTNHGSENMSRDSSGDFDVTSALKGSNTSTNNRTEDTISTGAEDTTSTGTEDTTSTGETNTESTGTEDTTSSGTANTASTGTEDTTYSESENEKNLFSNTPQDGLQDIINGTYLTDARVINKEKNGSSNVDKSNTTNSDESSSTKLDDSRTTKADDSRSTKVDDSRTTKVDDSRTTKIDASQNQTNNEESNNTGHSETNVAETSEKTASFVEDILNNKEYLENVSRETSGFSGDKIDTLMKYRESILQIPRMIIADLADLFISII